MALTVITGKDGTADLTKGGTSYKCVLDGFRIREVVEMSQSDTFCVEGVADQEPGRSQLQIELTGIGAKGSAISGPWIPCPQNVAIVATFSTGCHIDGSYNFTEASADRMVNQAMRISARGLSKGTYTVTWATS